MAARRPPVVITALGSPRPVMDAVKGYGGLVVADVIDLVLARKAIDAGVDGLACISAGAGGHTGHLSPFAFVSAVRDLFDGLVTVGGGIRGRCRRRGRRGRRSRPRLHGHAVPRATTESRATEGYKQMVVDHGPDDLVVSDGITGADASWLHRPSLSAHGLDPDDLGGAGVRSYDVGQSGQSEAKRWSQLWAAGQGLQSIRSVRPVGEVVTELEDEFRTAAARLERIAGHPHWVGVPGCLRRGASGSGHSAGLGDVVPWTVGQGP